MREVLRKNILVITLRTVIRQFNLLITLYFFVLHGMALGGVRGDRHMNTLPTCLHSPSEQQGRRAFCVDETLLIIL